MKKKDWTIPFTRPAVPHELLSAGFTPLLSMVLALRGIRTAAEAQTLISGGEELLCDPMLMLDMDKARERILRAIRDGETVAVYGDYDVDGITSTCLVTDYLRRKGIKCVPYIPDRNEEGYGLNCAALDTLKAQGVSLVITVDCGITAVEEAAHAAGLNIRRDRLDRFREALAAYYRRHRPAPLPEVCCDLLITDPSLLSVENVRSLDMLEPYGNANPKPIMCICGATLESASEVGGGKHLRMRVRLGASHFECIFFSHTARQLGISEGDAVDLAFTPQINEFRGNVSVQLVTAAVRRHDPTALCSAILAGDESANWAAAAYCPGRADFVRVWRAMDKNFAVGKDAADVIHQCIAGMPPEKFCLCLMVLRETGLLRSEDGSIYSSRCASISGKADLESTHLIRALRALA